jgi:hypothetical protein
MKINIAIAKDFTFNSCWVAMAINNLNAKIKIQIFNASMNKTSF